MNFLLGCILTVILSLTPIKTSEKDTQSITVKQQPKEVKKTILGTATWYGERFHNGLTANGEIYNMHSLTCATGDRSIPFNSKLKITNIKTGKSVIVRVNNRMNKRYHPKDNKGEFRIDLSVGAFLKLAPRKQGIIKVKIEKL